MPSSILFLVTLFGIILGVLLDGAIGGLLGGMGSFLILRVQQLSQRVKVLETRLENTLGATTLVQDRKTDDH